MKIISSLESCFGKINFNSNIFHKSTFKSVIYLLGLFSEQYTFDHIKVAILEEAI